MARIFGLLFSGFMVRLYAAIMAVTVGLYVWNYVAHVFATANHAMSVLG
jgi:hypothetical protein